MVSALTQWSAERSTMLSISSDMRRFSEFISVRENLTVEMVDKSIKISSMAERKMLRRNFPASPFLLPNSVSFFI